MAKLNKIKLLFPYLLILVMAGFILLPHLNKPLYGHHDFNGVFYGQIARNYLNLGLIKTKFGQATGIGLNPQNLNFHTHYPPLLPLLISLSYLIFGISDLTTRLVPAIFSILSLLLLFKLTQKLKFSLLASLTSMAVIFTPMFRYFSLMPDHEPLIIFFTLLSLYYYLELLNKPTKKLTQKFYLTTILNGLTAWAGYFLYPILVVHSYFFHQKTFKTTLKAIYILITIFIIHLTHTYILTGSFTGGGLINALILRLNLSQVFGQAIDPDQPQFSLNQYLVQQARWLTVYFTRLVILIGLSFLSFISYKIIKKIKLTQQQLVMLILFFWALCYPLIFSHVVFIHDYFNFFFLPFFAFSLAWLVSLIEKKQKYLAIIMAIILTIFIYRERLPFIKALYQTQAFKPGFKLGNLIKDTLKSNQKAYLFVSHDYLGNQEPFIKYYANRQVQFFSYDPAGLLEAQSKLTSPANVFTVTDNQPQLFIDEILATQSAIIKSFDGVNYYQLK